MDQTTIARYQTGGDIYASLQTQYGTAAANSIALAAQSGDETQINAALSQAMFGNPLNTSTASILLNNLATNPFGAPLADLEGVGASTVADFLKSPVVLLAIAAFVFFYFLDGLAVLKKAVAK